MKKKAYWISMLVAISIIAILTHMTMSYKQELYWSKKNNHMEWLPYNYTLYDELIDYNEELGVFRYHIVVDIDEDIQGDYNLRITGVSKDEGIIFQKPLKLREGENHVFECDVTLEEEKFYSVELVNPKEEENVRYFGRHSISTSLISYKQCKNIVLYEKANHKEFFTYGYVKNYHWGDENKMIEKIELISGIESGEERILATYTPDSLKEEEIEDYIREKYNNDYDYQLINEDFESNKNITFIPYSIKMEDDSIIRSKFGDNLDLNFRMYYKNGKIEDAYQIVRNGGYVRTTRIYSIEPNR